MFGILITLHCYQASTVYSDCVAHVIMCIYIVPVCSQLAW